MGFRANGILLLLTPHGGLLLWPPFLFLHQQARFHADFGFLYSTDSIQNLAFIVVLARDRRCAESQGLAHSPFRQKFPNDSNVAKRPG